MSDTKIKTFKEHLPPKDNAPKQLVILLHGLGSNGADLISLAPIWASVLPEAAFVSPDAPFVCDMAPGMMNSFQWFSLQDRSPDNILKGIETAAPLLEDFIKEQCDRFGLDLSRVALAGFSQGTMMSLYAGPRLPGKIAGILGYSGALIGEDAPGIEHKPPVHLVHGEADDVVPVQAWAHAKEALENAGFKVTGYTTPGLPHGIDEKGVQTGGEFLKSIFA